MASPQSSFVPQIGAKGVFTLLAPFDSLLMANVIYEVIAIRSLSDIVASGTNPYESYYEPFSISQEDYNTDIANKVCVVTLQADGGVVSYVPHNYISGYPRIGGVPYNAIMLGVDLQMVPDSMDLSFLIDSIKQLTKDVVGMAPLPDVHITTYSVPRMVSQAEHETLEAAREVERAALSTDRSRYLATQAQLNAALAKIAELEAFIVANYTPPPP